MKFGTKLPRNQLINMLSKYLLVIVGVALIGQTFAAPVPDTNLW